MRPARRRLRRYGKLFKADEWDTGDAWLLGPVTERIIGCAFRVANTLGHGFVEKVHADALAHEMRKRGLGVVQQQGNVELKVVGALGNLHIPQCRNYLRATGKTLCQPINVGRTKIEIRRVTTGA